MTTFAAEVAAKLQRAHERREDKDMSKDVWTTQLDQALELLNGLRGRGLFEGEPDSDENVGRVAELERQLESDRHAAERGSVYWNCQRCNLDGHKCPGCGETLNHWQSVCDDCQREHAHETCYVAREVPWSDVAAGMMTIARDGTAWMVVALNENGRFLLQNGVQTFEKSWAIESTERVRVLVPYVTPEQAEALVRDELGGTEVSSS